MSISSSQIAEKFRAFWKAWTMKDGDWHMYPDGWSAKTLIDGRKSDAPVLMRRWIDGHWQYREMTPDEEHEYAYDQAMAP